MIIGNINHLELIPYLPFKIQTAIEYVRDNINSNTPIGRYELDGDNLFLMLSENSTRYIYDAEPEYHKKYIDVQIVLNGLEGMAVSTLPPYTPVVTDNIIDNDIAFVKTPKEETLLVLQSNDFIVLYPNEVHKPLCAVANKIATVRKVVIKIALNYL